MTPSPLIGAACVGLAAFVWAARPESRLGGPRRVVFVARVRALVGRWSRFAFPAVIVIVLLVVGPIAVVPALVLAAAARVWWWRRRTARLQHERQRQDREDVRALRALAAELRSGLPPSEALRAAAGTAPPPGLRHRMLAAAVADRLGGDPALTLGAAAEPGSAASGVAAAWAVCQVTGAGLAAPVTRLADAAASGLLLAREAQAALASARSSARLLAILPVAGIGIGVVSGTGSLRVLFATGPGQLCLLAGTALELAGLVWLDRLAAAAA